MADFGGAKRHRQNGKVRVAADRPRDGKALRGKVGVKARSTPRPVSVPASDLERLSRRELVALVAKLNALTETVATPAPAVSPAEPASQDSTESTAPVVAADPVAADPGSAAAPPDASARPSSSHSTLGRAPIWRSRTASAARSIRNGSPVSTAL